MATTAPPLSLVASLDDFYRSACDIFKNRVTEEFLQFALHQDEWRKKWQQATEEIKRLQAVQVEDKKEIALLKAKRSIAQELLDKERALRIRAEQDRLNLERQLGQIRHLLFEQNTINDETREKLAFLNHTSFRHSGVDMHSRQEGHLAPIKELDSTGSILSELSYSRSEDDLDQPSTHVPKSKSQKRPSLFAEDAAAMKKKRPSLNQWPLPPSSLELAALKLIEKEEKTASRIKGNVVEVTGGESVIATTVVTVQRNGPITASSKIESERDRESETQCKTLYTPKKIPSTPRPRPSAPVKSDSDTDESFWATQERNMINESPIGLTGGVNSVMHNRPHTFCTKTVIKPEKCGPCGVRIGFGKIAIKCRDCRATSHQQCKDQVPLPCVGFGNTPTKRGVVGSIADYVPSVAPMVPAIIVHCVNEVEARGLSEVGIYRIPGSDREVKDLKEKFLRGKGAPNLRNYEVHVICGVLKDFLRSLSEPLIITKSRDDFVRAAELPGEDGTAALYQAVSELPQANKDTLAFIILHLQKVATCTDCKMPASNLAKVFGPTIVGYSCSEPSRDVLMADTVNQVQVMQQLLKIPSDFWSTFLNVEASLMPPTSEVIAACSAETPRKFFSGGTRSFRSKGQKFFGTPPIPK